MNIRLTVAVLLIGGLSMGQIARAEPRANVRSEIDFLLGYVEGSGCAFYRNGSWYDSRAAQSHLRDKYTYLVAQDQINSTDDFIEKAATASSFSGQPYEVRCNGGPPVTSNQWLRAELARFRMLK